MERTTFTRSLTKDQTPDAKDTMAANHGTRSNLTMFCPPILLLWLLLLLSPCRIVAVTDIVAITPDRSTVYPNGLHNGLWLSAKRLNLTLEVRDVGNFDPLRSAEVLRAAIESSDQPKVYCIWPVDFPSRQLMQELYETHGVPIIQMNQLPGADSQWEWDHLLGYAGPDDALRARNAGVMLVDAIPPEKVESPNVVALGYPESYGGYHLSIDAFAQSLQGSHFNLIERLPLGKLRKFRLSSYPALVKQT